MKNKILKILDELTNDYDRDVTLEEIDLIRDYITNLETNKKIEDKNLTLEQFTNAWEDSTREEILRQFYSDYVISRRWAKALNEIESIIDKLNGE